MTTPTAPFELHSLRVPAEWIDYNQHLLDGYYGVAFSAAVDAFMDYIGLDAAYRAATQGTIYTAESHIVFLREVKQGNLLRFKTYLLAHDTKRIHLCHEMIQADEGYVAATDEVILLHVNQAAGRVAPMPENVLAQLATIAEAHATLRKPAQVGRKISMTKQ